MKQKIRTALLLLLMVLGTGLVLMACGAKNLADSRTAGSDSYGLNVERMTETDSYQMELQKGEMLAIHFETVDDLNLHIAPGEIYGFIDHNGAGKTTTLKSVAGILQFDTGEIYIDGKSTRTQPLECKRSFAYIPDNPDLYDYMTGIKYLNFIADIFHISAADRQMRIRKYGDLFELTDDLAQPMEGWRAVCRAGCHLCGNARQRTLPVVHGALQSCLHEFYDRTFGIFGGKKPLAAAIAPGRVMEDLSGKNQDAAPFDRFAAAVVHRMHGSSLSLASDATADASSFCQLLYSAYGTGRSVLWR